jgi:hypothetical protein
VRVFIAKYTLEAKMRIQELLTETDDRGKETFRFMQHFFDIDAIRAAIKDKVIKPELVPDQDITVWATSMLGLDRNRPDHKPTSFMMRIDYDFLDGKKEYKFNSARLKEPVLLAEIPGGHIFIDGNHRIAKAYMSGIDTLPAYVLTKAQVKKAMSPRAKKIKIKESMNLSSLRIGDVVYVMRGCTAKYYEFPARLGKITLFRGDSLMYHGISDDPDTAGYYEFRTTGTDENEDDQFDIFLEEIDVRESLVSEQEWMEYKRKMGTRFMSDLIDDE